jgi:DNA-binding CsgD family transcriptional regulator
MKITGQPLPVQADPRSVLGFIALSEDDPESAIEHLGPLPEVLREGGVGEPGAYRFAPDLVEAQLAVSDNDGAEAVATWLEERGRRLHRAYALATGARCRGLVLAARGDLDGALASLDRALREHQRLPQPFELARTLLVKGQIERRAKHKRVARETLEQALKSFEDLGAPVWAGKARAELARIGGRAPGVADLTATEERVAALAADGLTNREIADRLFIGIKTVEGNLSRVYRKLGVRSRTELARRLGAA